MSSSSDFVYTSRAKDALLGFLKYVFSKTDVFNGQNPFFYSQDEKSSRIMIADYNTENLNSINIKPAILVNRSNAYPRKLGLGDKARQTFLGAYDERELLMNLDFSIQCYSREGLEAETLAVIIFKLLSFLNEDIQRTYEVYDVAVKGIGGEQPISDLKLVMVPVMVSIAIPDTLKINFNNIQLNKLTVTSLGEQLSDDKAR